LPSGDGTPYLGTSPGGVHEPEMFPRGSEVPVQMPLLLLLFIVPLIEVALFIEVGGIIGVWPTIAIAILTALLGSFLLRHQGFAALRDVQSRLAAGVNPGRVLADGAMIMIAGVLLLTPGFLTDAIGLLLLIPPVRGWIFGRLASRYTIRSVEIRQDRGARARGQTVEGEFEEVHPGRESADEEQRVGDQPSIGHDRR